MSSKKPTIGFKYYLGMHMIVCHGPVDEVEEIYAGERLAWQPTPGNDATKLTYSRTFYIDNPNLFGGEKKEGGVQGFIDLMMGEETQGPNQYLASVGQSMQPGWRGVVGFVLKQIYITSLTPYIKPWWFKIRRIPAQTWYSDKANIGDGGANGVHILYEAWTNEDWGMGYPAATLDDANWKAAADIVFDQGLSLSLLYVQGSSVEDFMFQILSHINGIMFTDYQTGLQRIKILTDDYDPINDTFVELDESNIIKMESFARPGYGEVVNEVVVKYRPRGATEDSSVTVQDLSVIEAQTGVTSQTVHYPGIDTDENAAKIAERDLKQLSTPLAKISLVVNRTGFNLIQGDVFKFSWASIGVSGMICRVVGIDFGSLEDRSVRIEAVEDIFGLGATSYVNPQESLWDDPYVNPEEVTDYLLFEAPFYFLAQEFGNEEAIALNDFASYAMSLSINPDTGANIGHALYASEEIDGFGEGFEPVDVTSNSGVLVSTADMSFTDTVFTYSDILSKNPTLVNVGDFLVIGGDEFVLVEAIDHGTRQVTVKRGTLDTVPGFRIAASRFYLVNNQFYSFDSTERTQGETNYYWIQGWSLLGYFSPNANSTDPLTMSGRQGKPYPPANVQMDGQYFPTSSRGDFTIEWSGRNKFLTTAPNSAVGWFEAAQSPEDGTTYRLEVFDATVFPEVLLDSYDDLMVDPLTFTGTFKYIPTSDTVDRYSVYLRTIRNGRTSEKVFSNTFDLFGYGFDYGNLYGGVEDGIILKPGAIIPPVGAVIPLPAPKWIDGRWRGITDSLGNENPSVSGDRYTWDGGVNGNQWSIANITTNPSASVKTITEYGNNYLVDQNQSSLTFFAKFGDADWQSYSVLGLPGLYVYGGRKEKIAFNDTDNIFVISINEGRDIVTTEDFINYTVHSDPVPPDTVAPNPVSTIINVVGILWNGSQYVAAGEVPGTGGFDPLTGLRSVIYKVAYSNGSDLLDWTEGDVVPTSASRPFINGALEGGYFKGAWFGGVGTSVSKSTDLINWTDISADVGVEDGDAIREVVITKNSLEFIGAVNIYRTTNGSSFSKSRIRYIGFNPESQLPSQFKGKGIPSDTRDEGPAEVLLRTAKDESLGGKIIGGAGVTSTPSAMTLKYPITANFSNNVGLTSRFNSSTFGVYNSTMTMTRSEALALASAAVPGIRKYWEVTVNTVIPVVSQLDNFRIGIRTNSDPNTDFFIYTTYDSKVVTPAFPTGVAVPITPVSGDIFGVEVDIDNDLLILYWNGTEYYRVEQAGFADKAVYPYLEAIFATVTINVGQEPFEYQPGGTQRLWN